MRRLTIIIILSLITVLLWLPYFRYGTDLAVGFDAGVNKLIMQTHAVGFWNDPLFYDLSESFGVVTGMNVDLQYLIVPFFLSLLLLLLSYVIFKRTLDHGMAILAFFLVGLTPIFSVALFHGYVKQILATIFLLTLTWIMIVVEEVEFKFIHVIVISILIAAAIFSHKAVGLIVCLAFGIYFIICLKNNRSNAYVKRLIYVGILSCILIAPRIFSNLNEYLYTLRDSLSMSAFSAINGPTRDVVGRSLISDGSLTSPFLQFFFFEGMIMIGFFVGLIYIWKKRNVPRLLFTSIVTSILFIWILVGANFSNRFVYNIYWYVVLIGVLGFTILLRKLDTRMFKFSIVLTLVYFLLLSVNISLEQRPYVINNSDGLDALRSYVPKNAVVFSPDYMGTVVAQLGYVPAFVAIEQDGENVIAMSQSDDFLLYGHSNLSLLCRYGLLTNVYVILDEWTINHPLPRASEAKSYDPKAWESSSYYELIYSGNQEFYRIYKLKQGISCEE